MVAAAAVRADGFALPAAGAALGMVAVSAWVRQVAVAAVLLAVLTVALAEPAPMFTVLAGLAAAMYLVLCHTRPTLPTVFFAVGFAGAAAVAVLLPVQVPWLPLAAPLALLAVYLLALSPFAVRQR
ncbi:hypothetical protein C6A87_001120 [Mycobacterium sp. ITM-2016-00317]|uniref:hypothetical protein n=1 Tax=Mycobacterium sp. ITM-2016-00317 TaxID=2099694 RepID=UPI000D42DB05|nr:hypothetical protein [Mycobacterium sp. ITM-2016-00317]WNG90532.1 hypothetical protein C6A87_001120 [Mycobacterium sp. ITM-2016-00317]